MARRLTVGCIGGTMRDAMRAIELFAGIGGLRLATGPDIEVVAAYDLDAEAGRTYAVNHEMTPSRRNLQTVRAEELLRHRADVWLLSPPCQPFTRRGGMRDLDDPRAAPLGHLIDLLDACRPRRLLLENVPGFHGSRAHAQLTGALLAIGHEVRDVDCCPSELGAPVRRRRHLVVSSADRLGSLEAADHLPRDRRLEDYLDPEPAAELRLPAERARRVEGQRPAASQDSCLRTFTSSYGRAITGAGPLLWEDTGPRYFSPEEILRLHGFPASFRFAPGTPLAIRFRLAGNSVHVAAIRRVAALIAG